MPALETVDQVEILILVDNVTDNLSSTPAFVETEIAALGRRRRGAWVLAGDCLCCAAHGLACLVTVKTAGQSRTLLFDAGPEDGTFEQNASRLGADLGAVEAMVLSHGHWDHGGAMLRALQIVRDRNGGREVPYYAHPDMFRTRAARLPDGSMRLMQDVPGVADLTAYGAGVINTAEPHVLLDGLAFVSGEIPRITPFETGLPGQHRRTLDGQGWEVSTGCPTTFPRPPSPRRAAGRNALGSCGGPSA
jgi:7,8-dihydropterin-6-yl-methyl-4-(beta-D-ribofuranosyl)aminobenzene 5'-phosphate synthase